MNVVSLSWNDEQTHVRSIMICIEASIASNTYISQYGVVEGTQDTSHYEDSIAALSRYLVKSKCFPEHFLAAVFIGAQNLTPGQSSFPG
jgi:hypothetical protein